jgi:hypothetical protein
MRYHIAPEVEPEHDAAQEPPLTAATVVTSTPSSSRVLSVPPVVALVRRATPEQAASRATGVSTDLNSFFAA